MTNNSNSISGGVVWGKISHRRNTTSAQLLGGWAPDTLKMVPVVPRPSQGADITTHPAVTLVTSDFGTPWMPWLGMN